ncbi:MAG: histidinol-phosphate transaminase [Actinomycetota bacterium]
MRKTSPLSVRADLVASEPYISPQVPARHRLNTNESPYAPPQGVIDEVVSAMQHLTLNRYPDRDATSLFDAISQHISWPSEGLWVANGSNEVFMHLLLTFGGHGRKSLTFEPTYSLHSLIPRIAGTATVQVGRNQDWLIDLDQALKAIESERPEIIIVCSPNNPTGNVEPIESIEVLLEHAPGLVVVDEAYIEFTSPEKSLQPLLGAYSNLVVTRSFSKAWRLAGARLGYMMADPSIVEDLRRVRLPYHLSAMTQLIGEAALKHTDETLQLVSALVEERDLIAMELQTLGLKVFPSQANFVLFEVPDPSGTWQKLLDRGVLVRKYEADPKLERCLRVTCGLPEESQAFLRALREVLDA